MRISSKNGKKNVGKMVGYNKVVKSVREFKSYHQELKGDANVFMRYKNYRNQHRAHEYLSSDRFNKLSAT